jgi:hypothetical protein
MTMLDVNTPRGQVTLSDEEKAVAMFIGKYPAYGFVHTDKTTMAKMDGMLTRDGKLVGMVLTSCRYNCSVSTFEDVWDWEWLVTWNKVALGAWIAKHMQTRLYGFIYVVDYDTLLVKKLYDPSLPLEQRWVTPIRVERTPTQKTVNGGKAWRRNAYIKIDKATRVTR